MQILHFFHVFGSRGKNMQVLHFLQYINLAYENMQVEVLPGDYTFNIILCINTTFKW